MFRKSKFLLIIGMALLLIACSNNQPLTNKTNSDGDLAIYTTVYPLQYFTERIGGEYVDVQSIYPAGADEHTFDPTQKDMIALADADLFFTIGLGLEGFVEKAEKTLKNEHVKMIATADSIPANLLEEDHEEDHDHNHSTHTVDPHVWISPVLSQYLAESIKNSLIESLPEQRSVFEQNFEELKLDLETLDEDFKRMATTAQSKTFFVSHAAFGYLADTYGLEQIAIAGLNSQSEPSQKQLTAIVQQAQELNVKYVLFEQNISSKLTEVIRKELGAESLMLHNLSVLTTEDIQNEENYFTLMKRNINTLETALNQ